MIDGLRPWSAYRSARLTAAVALALAAAAVTAGGASAATLSAHGQTMSTAEWIEETPLEIGTNAGFAALPNLTNPAFSSGTVNGSTVALSPSEEMDLIDSNGNVIGAPSAPNSAGSGFDACAWASSCS
jgi:hypothetical protein